MNNTGILRNRCPKCGGKIIVSELIQKSYNRMVKKDGTLPRRAASVDYAGGDGTVAYCKNSINWSCDVRWDIDEFDFDSEGRFIDLKYTEEEDEFDN